ncbi:MAG: ABC transporter ATP-binding protein [Lachnospiraceae bacterium]|nr:ABC transporter ATP-binding protein [Lachnospiraceae bacterium]
MKQKLEVNQVSYSYHTLDGETPALSHVSFTVRAGEFLAIVGPSGCGKSTLLSLLCGLAKPESGSILIDQKPFAQTGEAIGYMLQKDHLFEWRSVLSNVSLGLEIQKRLNADSRSDLIHMLKTYGLEQFQEKRPSQLSGGMRQRAALIRTLALKPDLLLLDEPFSALDYQTRLSVCDDISSIIRSAHKTAILVTHDLSEAISVADRIIVLSARPGTVKKIVPVSFPEKKASSGENADGKPSGSGTPAPGSSLSPMERRNAPEFSRYFNQIWKELKSDD